MKKLLILFFAVLIAVPAFPQNFPDVVQKTPWGKFGMTRGEKRPAFSPWEFMKKEDAFITDKAKLTMVEANIVCPLLHKMKDEQRALDFKIHRLLDQTKNEEISEKACKSILEKIARLNAKKLVIEADYHKQMLNVISAKKLLLLLQADMKFERFMLHKMFMTSHCKQGACTPKGKKRK